MNLLLVLLRSLTINSHSPQIPKTPWGLNAIGWPRTPKMYEATKLCHQMAFRWRADDGLLIALSLSSSTIKWHWIKIIVYRNASIRINLLFVVTIRINWYVSVNRSFSERFNSFSCVGYKSLQCAYVRYSSQNIAEMRLLIVIFR